MKKSPSRRAQPERIAQAPGRIPAAYEAWEHTIITREEWNHLDEDVQDHLMSKRRFNIRYEGAVIPDTALDDWLEDDDYPNASEFYFEVNSSQFVVHLPRSAFQPIELVQ